MSTITCRDCGNTLAPDVRGCPNCALNFEIERNIDRWVWRVGAVLLTLLVVGALVVYLGR